MKDKRIIGVVIVLCWSCQPLVAEAQSLLQRLGDQISQQLAPPPPPADSLPPPRAAVPGPVAPRASLGIRVAPVTDEVVREQRLVVRRGAVIQAIEQGSPADRAGLPLGAVIVAVDGRRIDSPDDLVQAIQASRPGQDVELTYYAQSRLARKKVHLLAAPIAQAIPLESVPPVVPPSDTTSPGNSNTLERELGADGNRPLLGRIGRALDGLAAPAQAVVPVEPGAPQVRSQDLELEVRELRQQVSELTKQMELLRQQISSLEKKISEK